MNKEDRLTQLIDSLHLSQTEFGKALGYPDGAAIGHIRNGRAKVGNSLVLRIQNSFPLVNVKWLLTGEGEMLKKS